MSVPPVATSCRPVRRRGNTRFRKPRLSANRPSRQRRSWFPASRRVVLLGPFGEPLANPIGVAAEMPFRFSTKYHDVETGLYSYIYRPYDPLTGRWLSRDPIGEEGGVNLYGFVGNDSVNGYDPFGLWEDGPDGIRVRRDPVTGYFQVNPGDDSSPPVVNCRAMEIVLNDSNKENLTRALDRYVRELRRARVEFMWETYIWDAYNPEAARWWKAALGGAYLEALGGGGGYSSRMGLGYPSRPFASPPSVRRYTNGVCCEAKLPEMKVYFYTPTNTRDYDKIVQSRELWGRPTRFSLSPSVNAHPGPLPQGTFGLELGITVPPARGQNSKGGTMTGISWHIDTPGIRIVDDDTIAVPVTIIRVVKPSGAPAPK